MQRDQEDGKDERDPGPAVEPEKKPQTERKCLRRGGKQTLHKDGDGIGRNESDDPRWRATISAPNTAKTMGMAIPQPSASTKSNRLGRVLRWVAQDTNWTAAPITARPQSAQGSQRMEREEVIASDLVKWLCAGYDNT